ncbi:GntR family transcriptional regulator [Bradyrhizobium macuxiense]|uniref:GntR family transcriptional regulator n=1 Tax=Bradyrhizobium macuxiense TaxID=1755647 RepID=A0A109K4U6_9BRAD|nr:FCD domain-containing protein [Bradyrhizobium macuxiense]KWV60733.1 GntR family transcriptional regulator [Bradyrhizobium macuxiense]
MPATPLFRRLDVAPAYQKVADAIEREIINGRIKPGEPIGTEQQLVEQFGVNRSTVREGIRVLEEGGLIRRDSSRRLQACLPRYNKLATRLSRALILHEVTFRELFEASMTLEVASVEGAVERATAENIAELSDNLARSAQAVGNPADLAELDQEFHVLMAKASQNRVLQLAREPAAQLFFPTTEMIVAGVPEGGARLVEAHRHLLDAIKRRDKEAGVAWTRRHLQDWRRGFEKIASLDRSVEHTYMEHAGATRQ